VTYLSGVRRGWCWSRSARQASLPAHTAQVRCDLPVWSKEGLVLEQECTTGLLASATAQVRCDLPVWSKEGLVLEQECTTGLLASATAQVRCDLPVWSKEGLVLEQECTTGLLASATPRSDVTYLSGVKKGCCWSRCARQASWPAVTGQVREVWGLRAYE
jgi:hypothetical protein